MSLTTSGFFFAVYLLCGLGFYIGSEPYRPQSRRAFDACFQSHRGIWFIMVFIASCLWPLLALNMAYRFIFLSKKEDNDANC
jgi:nitrate reductase NapE component